MKNEKSLRKHLLALLQGAQAHADFEAAIKDFPPSLRGKRPNGSPHSPWEILEHMRLAQWDILEFIRNPHHQSPEFPDGYWPAAAAPPNDKAWDKSVSAFRADQAALVALVANESTDLFVKLPQGDGQTILREALLVADHNAYHLGQFFLLRRSLEATQ